MQDNSSAKIGEVETKLTRRLWNKISYFTSVTKLERRMKTRLKTLVAESFDKEPEVQKPCGKVQALRIKISDDLPTLSNAGSLGAEVLSARSVRPVRQARVNPLYTP